MQQFSVATCDPQNLLSLINDVKGINVRLDGTNVTFYTESAPEMKGLKSRISHYLTRHILDSYEKRHLTRIINRNYCYLPSNERRLIAQSAIAKSDQLLPDGRVNEIEKKIFDYTMDSDRIVLEGFLNFRLPEYKQELQAVAKTAVDEYMTAKEYNEFIALLKCFVDIQEPKLSIVHVVAEPSGQYTIYNQSKIEITHQCTDDFLSDYDVVPVNFDDILISSLITLAPRRIVFHKNDNIAGREVFETLRRVFEGKLRVCKGCQWCDSLE